MPGRGDTSCVKRLYGIVTDNAFEVPASFTAVMLSDWRLCTRSLVLLPFCKVNGMAIRNDPPKVCEVVPWNQEVAAELTSTVSCDVENFEPCLGVI